MRLLISLFLFLLFSSPAWAVTWYVRDGGGTPSQCTGKTNSIYPGSGSNQNCAFSNPMFVGGAGCGNTGFGPCTVAALWSTGDTVNIDGDSDTSPGNQAQYPIGYDASGIITPSGSGNCTASGALNCTMSNLSDGMTIQTTPGSTHQAQLWGREHLNQVINDNASASSTVINNLEITQHSACVYNGADPGHTTDGFPNRCETSSAPFGPWGIDGLALSGTGITLENNWIHGMGQWGIETNSLTGLIEENNIIDGNGGGGVGLGQIVSGGSMNLSGTITVLNEIIVFNGCGSHYPLHSTNPFDILNYHTCADDSSSNGTILADGWACEASTCNTSGATINMSNTNVSYNTKGGIDNLHANGTGTIHLYRVRAEGNESQQIKLNYGTVYVENSQFMNNCNYFQGQTFTTSCGGDGSCPPSLGYDFCRAAGNTARFAIQSGGNWNVSNSTFFSSGGANIEIPPGGSCESTAKLYMYNNIIINSLDYTSNYSQNTSFWENDAGGSCNPVVEDYNLNYQPQTAQCAGAHDICTNPANAGVTGGFNLSTNSAGGQSYGAEGLSDQFYASNSGPLITGANSSLVLSGTSNDYNSLARSNSTYTIGSYTQNSCVPNGDVCFNNGECCGGSCTNNICGGAVCTPNGGLCSGGPVQSSCCSNLCSLSSCVACIATGNTCSVTANCCTGTCTGSVCVVIPGPNGAPMTLISGNSHISGNSSF